MTNVVQTSVPNRRVFTHQLAQDAHVVVAQYKRANGIPSPSNNDTNNP
jgi:hypothetical protein